MSPNAHPAPVVFPVFELPGFLSARKAMISPQVRSVRLIARPAQVKALASATGADGFNVPLPDRGIFARFLAKVALGFAVACVGFDRFEEVFVKNAILGTSEDVGTWVGSTEDQPVGRGSGVHELSAELANDILSVKIRLFAQLKTPEYLVIVGRISQ